MKIKPNLDDSYLTKKKIGINENFKRIKLDVIEERPVTLFLNDQEIVTMMTINDYPKYLGIGYLLNQNMIKQNTKIDIIEYHPDISSIIVRTKKSTNFENKLKKKLLHLDVLKEHCLEM